MAYTKDQIEWLHDNGYMPDWAYYQQNDKSPTMNLFEQTKKIKERALQAIKQREEEARRKEDQKKQEKEVEKQIEKQLEQGLEKAMQEILGGFCK